MELYGSAVYSSPQIPRVNLTVRTYSVQHIASGPHKQTGGDSVIWVAGTMSCVTRS